MAEHFWGCQGDTLCLSDQKSALAFLSSIDTSVPARTKGRKSSHRERYCIVEFLKHCLRTQCFELPIIVEKTESPDFILRNSKQSCGLEVCDAGCQEWQQAIAELEKKPGAILYSASFKKKFTPLTTSDIMKTIIQPKDKDGFKDIIGFSDGWNDEEVWETWWEAVCYAIRKKTQDLNDPQKLGYQTHNIYGLLIYENTPAFLIDDEPELFMQKLKMFLPDFLGTLGCEREFDFITVISGKQIGCYKRQDMEMIL